AVLLHVGRVHVQAQVAGIPNRDRRSVVTLTAIEVEVRLPLRAQPETKSRSQQEQTSGDRGDVCHQYLQPFSTKASTNPLSSSCANPVALRQRSRAVKVG